MNVGKLGKISEVVPLRFEVSYDDIEERAFVEHYSCAYCQHILFTEKNHFIFGCGIYYCYHCGHETYNSNLDEYINEPEALDFIKTNRKYFRKSPAVCTAKELNSSILDDWLHLRSKEEEFEEILNKCSQE